MRRFSPLIIFVLILTVLGTPAQGFDITLAWDPSTESNIVGYKLYADENGSGEFYQINYFDLKDIDPNNPQCTVIDMKGDITYHFAVTAINTEDLESIFSNQVSVLNGQALLPLSPSSGGGGGGGCFIAPKNNPQFFNN